MTKKKKATPPKTISEIAARVQKSAKQSDSTPVRTLYTHQETSDEGSEPSASPQAEDTALGDTMDQTTMLKSVYQKIHHHDALPAIMGKLSLLEQATKVTEDLAARLTVLEERMNSGSAAGFSGRYEATSDIGAINEDKVPARVPVKLLEEKRLPAVLQELVQQHRNGASYALDILPWLAKPGANAGSAAGPSQAPAANGAASGAQRNRGGTEEPTALVDILINPRVRKSFVTLGKIARERYGITLMDSLTKSGKQLRQQRMATFIHLRNTGAQPRWERGVDITVMDGQRRVPFQGPWVDSQPAGAEVGGAAGQTPRGAAAGKA
ncbi:hypothetical protein VOLCADRAFT_93321 [Volvox carteri f. nagariensis]|uniref:Uncharacterized protein n=1 Tax=Volvox carteri f. nagariensis TaxID=3068 RepID=D8U1U3_VOLCA|nr:uncharacterized protein VOLCADRAFT_93321 [Volvox carteri f. nagariensis]EFJ46241.1 hypothetical protein VOLCADRAFT_93321 [Volvox carteri f. nagariensis]|eukprot:XP_002952688.1 hypothetical protein VOLCADRAFT_93321 [Volvox carteri f. nagariensis]